VQHAHDGAAEFSGASSYSNSHSGFLTLHG
jgi:hypothetical protein